MPLTVLAVEHDPALRDLYHALLTERGHTVRLVSTGPEAISKLDIDVDVIVVDLRSRQSQGEVVLDAVRSRAIYQKLPVLIVDGAQGKATAGIEARAMTLRKPFVLTRFVQAIEALAATTRRGTRH